MQVDVIQSFENYRAAEKALEFAGRLMDNVTGDLIAQLRKELDFAGMRELVSAMPDTVRKAMLIDIMQNEMVHEHEGNPCIHCKLEVDDAKGAKMKHPTQPLHREDHGIARFKENTIVKFLLDNGPYDISLLATMNFLDNGPYDMNLLTTMNFSEEDRKQFTQLVGYSLAGYSDLHEVSDDEWEALTSKISDNKNSEARK